MLLAMLVTILTMIFNQSSVAWTTGVASVTSLGDLREGISIYSGEAENAIRADDGVTVIGITSVWDENGDGLRKDEGRTLKATFEKTAITPAAMADPMNFSGGRGNEIELSGSSSAGGVSFLVGVHSYGPDGKTGGDYSWDDISTMPEEVVK